MKLKPIALAIPMVLAAGSLSAAEIYSSDANSVELSGWAKAFGNVLSTDFEKEEEVDGKKQMVDQDSGFHVKTDAEFSMKATHEIDELSKVIGSFVVKFADSSGDKTAKFDGIKFEYDHTDIGNISIGDTGNSFGVVSKAHAGEGNNLYSVSQGGVAGQGIRYKKSVEDFNFSANYETDSDSSNESNFALSGEYKVADEFSVALAYGSDGDEANSVGIGADIHFGDLKLGAAFINFENAEKINVNESVELSLDTPNDGQTFSIVAQYEMEDVTLYTSAQAATGEAKAGDFDAMTMYAGANYNFTDSIITYVVVQHGKMEKAGQENDATNFKFGAKYTF